MAADLPTRALPIFNARLLTDAVKAAGPPLLFGLRLWASVCLALWVAFWLELDNAFWAGTWRQLFASRISVRRSARAGSA